MGTGGALVLLVGLGLTNRALGGRFLFLIPSFTFAGNHLATAYVRTFSVAALDPYVLEGRSDDTPATATPLTLAEDPAGSGLRSAYGRGNLSSRSDVDYFGFAAEAGDRLTLAAEAPGAPYYSVLGYTIVDADGKALIASKQASGARKALPELAKGR